MGKKNTTQLVGFILITLGLLSLSFYYVKENFFQSSVESPYAKLDIWEKSGIPDFSLIDFKGQKKQITAISSNIKIINFWASWCGPCAEEFPSMIRLTEKLQNVELIAISQDEDSEAAQTFLKTLNIQRGERLEIGIDSDRSLGRIFDVQKLPETFIIKPDGTLARKITGSIVWDSPEAVEYIQSLAK